MTNHCLNSGNRIGKKDIDWYSCITPSVFSYLVVNGWIAGALSGDKKYCWDLKLYHYRSTTELLYLNFFHIVCVKMIGWFHMILEKHSTWNQSDQHFFRNGCIIHLPLVDLTICILWCWRNLSGATDNHTISLFCYCTANQCSSKDCQAGKTSVRLW